MQKKLILVFTVFIIAACGSGRSVFIPVASDVAKIKKDGTSVNLEDLKTGFNLYVTNCAGCHWLPVPSTKKKSEWESVFPEMFAKVQLKGQEQQLIKQYVYSKL